MPDVTLSRTPINHYDLLMQRPSHRIQTDRLILRSWQPSDLASFAQMHADIDVMSDLGGPISARESRIKFERYSDAYETFGYSRWCVLDRQNRFIGYVGIVHRGDDQPLGEHDEVGWRLRKEFWGQGFATEAAKATLRDARRRLKLRDILSYTSHDNLRSQSVMRRLSLVRAADLDTNWRNEDGSEEPIMVWRVPNLPS